MVYSKEPTLEVFAGDIFYFRGVLEDPEKFLLYIDETENEITTSDAISKWYEWQASNSDYIFGQKKDVFLHKMPSTSEKTKYLVDSIQQAVLYVEKAYTSAKNKDIGICAPVCISKYFTGKKMGPHVDGDENGTNNPVMSAVIYVNDDYTGGNIDFPNQGISIKPEAGSIVMFPSMQPFIHNPTEIQSGEKIVCPAFWFKR